MNIDGLPPEQFQRLMSPGPLESGRLGAANVKKERSITITRFCKIIKRIGDYIEVFFRRLAHFALTRSWENNRKLVQHLKNHIENISSEDRSKESLEPVRSLFNDLGSRLSSSNKGIIAIQGFFAQVDAELNKPVSGNVEGMKGAPIPGNVEGMKGAPIPGNVEGMKGAPVSGPVPPINLPPFQVLDAPSLSPTGQQTKPPGIPNGGNFCWMNSVLQIFFGDEFFARMIEQRQFPSTLEQKVTETEKAFEERKEKMDEKRRIHQALVNFGHCYKTKNEEEIEKARLSFHSVLFATSFKKNFDPASPFGEEDAHALCLILLEVLNCKVRMQYTRKGVVAGIEYSQKPPEVDSFNCIDLAINQGGDLQTLLTKHFNWSTQCDSGNPLRVTVDDDTVVEIPSWFELCKLLELPDFLFVKLNRYKTVYQLYEKENTAEWVSRSVRSTALVNFPSDGVIDLSCATSNFQEGKSQYAISRVIHHSGTESLSSGHYWADVKLDNQWWRRNDNSVTPFLEETVLKNGCSTSYIIVLQRIKGSDGTN